MGVVLVTAVSCIAPPAQRLISNPDPSGKIPAIKESAESRDQSAIRQLIADLDNEDSAVRFYAIEALERLTGQTFGYQYFVDEQQRAAAVARWQAWLAGWEAGHRGQQSIATPTTRP